MTKDSQLTITPTELIRQFLRDTNVSEETILLMAACWNNSLHGQIRIGQTMWTVATTQE